MSSPKRSVRRTRLGRRRIDFTTRASQQTSPAEQVPIPSTRSSASRTSTTSRKLPPSITSLRRKTSSSRISEASKSHKFIQQKLSPISESPELRAYPHATPPLHASSIPSRPPFIVTSKPIHLRSIPLYSSSSEAFSAIGTFSELKTTPERGSFPTLREHLQIAEEEPAGADSSSPHQLLDVESPSCRMDLSTIRGLESPRRRSRRRSDTGVSPLPTSSPSLPVPAISPRSSSEDPASGDFASPHQLSDTALDTAFCIESPSCNTDLSSSSGVESPRRRSRRRSHTGVSLLPTSSPSPPVSAVSHGSSSGRRSTSCSDDSLTRALLQVPPIPFPGLPSAGESPDVSRSSNSPPLIPGLDTASALFLLRHQPPQRLAQPSLERPAFSTAIDPFAVGVGVMSSALQENFRLDDDLRRDAESINWQSQGSERPCPCDVARHPSWWSSKTIINVHNYSFLLDCKDLEVMEERVVASNINQTIVVYSVPMEDGQMWKRKAEQVLRFIDVELDVGDQAAYDIFHYYQPCDRKMLLIISGHKVMGLVLAERQQTAQRILTETVMYRDLEETPVQVRAGINQLWIHVSMRRQHLATLLLEQVRRLLYEGETLRREDLAFNDVSEVGVLFARKFLGTFRVPLYTGKPGR